MKNPVLLLPAFFLIFLSSRAQVFTPLTTTGYNLDAIAEAISSSVTTGGAIDGSNYVMYSVAYGTNFSGATGLPNNGLIASGTRTYQLQQYTFPNTLYITAGLTDSLVFSSTSNYGALSILGFATEGTGSIDITLRFGDNSTQVYSNTTLADWFSTNTAIISGFDRCNRTSGTPNYQTTQPKMFATDLVINCANRSKTLSSIKFQNTGTNARLCIMAVSASAIPSFTAASTAVSCSGGTNGSATITPAGGFVPYSYTVFSSPSQFNGNPSNLPVGTFSYLAQDAAACPVSGTFAVTQSLVTQPPLLVTASSTFICEGSTLTLTATGANSFTWSNSFNAASFTITPATAQQLPFTVQGHTSDNCLRTGSITIQVNPKPIVSLTGLPAAICVNGTTLAVNVSPSPGSLTGPGVTGTTFDPSALAPGTHTISYSYTNTFGCASGTSALVVVNAVPVISFSLLPGKYCVNANSASLSAQPLGGSFSGTGVTGASFSPSLAGVGTALITYSYTDSNNCSASSAVTATILELPAVTFTLSKRNFCQNSTSYPLNANPSTGQYTGPGVTGSFFYPVQAGVGTHTILYTYTNLNGCTTQAMVTTTVSNCTGIGENEMQPFNLYPNPSSSCVFLTSPRDLDLLVYNETGQLVLEVSLNMGNNYSGRVENLASGIYFVADKDTSRIYRKLIITR